MTRSHGGGSSVVPPNVSGGPTRPRFPAARRSAAAIVTSTRAMREGRPTFAPRMQRAAKKAKPFTLCAREARSRFSSAVQSSTLANSAYAHQCSGGAPTSARSASITGGSIIQASVDATPRAPGRNGSIAIGFWPRCRCGPGWGGRHAPRSKPEEYPEGGVRTGRQPNDRARTVRNPRKRGRDGRTTEDDERGERGRERDDRKGAMDVSRPQCCDRAGPARNQDASTCHWRPVSRLMCAFASRSGTPAPSEWPMLPGGCSSGARGARSPPAAPWRGRGGRRSRRSARTPRGSSSRSSGTPGG